MYLQYNWKVEEKPGQGSALMLRQALPGSHCACLAQEVPPYLAELLLCFTSGAECCRGSAVQQLAFIYPRWWYLRDQLSNVSTMRCLGFAKSHHDPEKPESSHRTPQIGWKKPALCVGEVGSRNDGGARRSPRERSSGKEEAGYICREGTFSFPEGLQRMPLALGPQLSH